MGHLGEDGGKTIFLRDAGTQRGDPQRIRAISVPPGKVLWTHSLPRDVGWIGWNPGSGFLTEPLPIDLDGDGKPEVIVPDEHGAIAVLDGASGKVLWRSSVAINKGQPSAATVLVGPDLDGDGRRDLFVANVVNVRSDLFDKLARGNVLGLLADTPPDHGHFIRFQALSGKTGSPLWRSRFQNSGGLENRELGLGMPLLAWQKGGDGWPLVVIPGDRQTLVVEASTGRLAHLIKSVRGPTAQSDLDGDGIPELIGLEYALERHGWRERLHRFRGVTLETAVAEPVTPREETVEWMSYPLGSLCCSWHGPVSRSGFAGPPGNGNAARLPGVPRLRRVPPAVQGLARPVRGPSSILRLVLGLTCLFLVYRPVLEPWQRWSWAVWSWILLAALFVAGVLALGWLGIVALVRLLRLIWLVRVRVSPPG